MSILYETTGNEHDSTGYVSLNGYTMHREQRGFEEPWVLRDPNGEFVGKGAMRNIVARKHGFQLDTRDSQ